MSERRPRLVLDGEDIEYITVEADPETNPDGTDYALRIRRSAAQDVLPADERLYEAFEDIRGVEDVGIRELHDEMENDEGRIRLLLDGDVEVTTEYRDRFLTFDESLDGWEEGRVDYETAGDGELVPVLIVYDSDEDEGPHYYADIEDWEFLN